MVIRVYSQENARKVADEALHQIQEMFGWLDTPGSGEVSRDEFERLKGYVLRLAFNWYERPTRYMRYFTTPESELLSGEKWRRYREHLDQIAEFLPTELLTFSREASLHDGVFRRFDVDEASTTIDIQVEVPQPVPPEDLDWENTSVVTEDKMIRVALHYEGASVVGGITDELIRIVNAPDVQVLADEIDVAGGPMFEHRLLLHPEGDFAIRFSTFSFTQEEIAEPGVG